MQKRFVSIWFPYLATDWHASKQPQLHKKPFVLKSSVHNRILVTAANALAKVQGVEVGMALADAVAIFPGLEILLDKPALKEHLLQRIAEWCIRFTPVASPDPPDGILLDATGCAHLWGGEETYLAAINSCLTAKGYTARICMADTIGLAWALARFGKEPLLALNTSSMEALWPLPPAALRVEDDTVTRLHKLGLHRIKDFIAMPRPALRRRFGTEMIRRLQQAMGEEEEMITPVHPPEPYRERLPCLEPVLTLTGIEMALQLLLEAVCRRLREEGKGLRSAIFRGYRVDGVVQEIGISTAKASQNATHLFYLFALKFSTFEPAEGIELFILDATKVEDYKPVQESLWEGVPGMDNRQLAELVDRIAGKVGMNAISRYLPAGHYWPEHSFKKASALDEQPTTAWKTNRPRPLILLTQPEPIEVTAPVPDYPPMNFRYKKQLHKIIKADGPERIEQEWWIQQGEHRDYYIVEDEEGRRYWLFRSGHYNAGKIGGWFIHGFFS